MTRKLRDEKRALLKRLKSEIGQTRMWLQFYCEWHQRDVRRIAQLEQELAPRRR